MKHKGAYLLAFTLISLIHVKGYSQDYSFRILSKGKHENSFLKKIIFKKKHKDSSSIYNEIKKTQIKLKKSGYFLNTLDSLKIDKKYYTAYFSLRNKIDSVVIENKVKNLNKNNLGDYEKVIKIKINELESTLNKISKNLEENGNSFSKITLKNLRIKNKILFAELKINNLKERKITKLVFKGYDNFPKSFIKNYYNINKRTLFNKKKLLEISDLTRNLDFVSEIKKPETLFTKDSTIIYVYIKEQKKSSFDGLINFSSTEGGKINFNGHLDLNLKNIFKTGESLNLNWNSLGNERQELAINIKTPYLFNTKLRPELKFSIYKQDSTFINTKLEAKLKYQIKQNSNLFISVTSDNSEELINNEINNIDTYENTFWGIGYEFTINNNDIFDNNKFHLSINPSFGKRKSKTNSLSQIKLESTITYLININKRNYFYLKNEIGYLNSDNYIQNEIFRIGGSKSIRGFVDKSLFVENHITQNIEYRYLTSDKSYLYTITDFALTKVNDKKENLIGLGIGYLFNTNNSQINISTAIARNIYKKQTLTPAVLFIKWTSFF